MRNWLKVFLSVSALMLTLHGMILAGDAGRESQFSIGSGIRAVSMGGGFAGLADDASAIYWNQAALALLDYQEVDVMHVTLFEGTIYDVASYAYPHPRLGGFGISFMRLGTGNIVKRIDWNESGEFNYSILQLLLGYGREIKGGFFAGTALKIVNQSLDDNSTYGAGLDISFFKRIDSNITAGILFQDIVPPRLRLDGDLETIPYTIMGGMAIKNLMLFRNTRHIVNFGVEKPEERSIKVHVGVETIYQGWLDFRVGLDRSNLTFGLGFYHKRLRLGYAYRIMNGITDSHRIGLSFKIGMPVTERIRRETELLDARGSYLILDDREKQFELYEDIADKFHSANDLDSALVYYQRALAYRDDDEEVLKKVRNINDSLRALTEREKDEISREESRQSLLDGYYSQAREFYSRELYVVSLDLVEVALGIDRSEQRFLSLKDEIDRKVKDKINELLGIARTAEQEGRLSNAVIAYGHILDLSPGDTATKASAGRLGSAIDLARLVSRGVELFYLGRLSAAEQDFTDVLKSAPKNIVAKKYLEKIVSVREQPTVQDDLEKDEEVWRIYLNGLEFYQNGDYERAIELWQRVLEYYPGNEQTLNNIKQARLRLQPEE